MQASRQAGSHLEEVHDVIRVEVCQQDEVHLGARTAHGQEALSDSRATVNKDFCPRGMHQRRWPIPLCAHHGRA
jgi:hypothetical protein